MNARWVTGSVFLSGFVNGVTLPMVAGRGTGVDMSLGVMGAVLAVSRFTRLVTAPFVGAAVDRFGARRLISLGLWTQVLVLGAYAFGCLTRELAASFFVGRALLGPASACVSVAAQTLALSENEGHAARSAAGGAVRAAAGAGLPAGLVLGAVIMFAGSDLVLLGTAGLLITCAAVAITLLPSTLGDAPRNVHPSGEPGVLRDGYVAGLSALSFALSFSTLGLVLTGVMVLSVFGSMLLGLMVTSMALATLATANRLKHPRHTANATVVAASGLVVGMALLAASRTTLTTAASLAIMGISSGSLSASLTSAVACGVAPSRRGRALGAMQWCSDVGGATGPIVAVALIGSGSLWSIGALIVASFVPVALFVARRATRPLNLVAGAVVFFVALPVTAEPRPRGPFMRDQVSARYNPLGAFNELRAGYASGPVGNERTPLGATSTSIAANASVSPVFARGGAAAELELPRVSVYSIYEAGVWFDAPMHQLILGIDPRVRFGPVVARANNRLVFEEVGGGTGDRFFDLNWEIIFPNGGFIYVNDVDVVVQAVSRWRIGARYNVTHAFLTGEDVTTHRAGPLVSFLVHEDALGTITSVTASGLANWWFAHTPSPDGRETVSPNRAIPCLGAALTIAARL